MSDDIWLKVKPDWWRCSLCGHRFDMRTYLTVVRVRLAKLPNTYSGLDDHNRTEWECPECKQWQSTLDDDE